MEHKISEMLGKKFWYLPCSAEMITAIIMAPGINKVCSQNTQHIRETSLIMHHRAMEMMVVQRRKCI